MKEAVKSSNVEAMDYDKKRKVLTIFFKNGGTYEYENVTEAMKERLRTSGSFGSALHKLRKEHNWKYKKIS